MKTSLIYLTLLCNILLVGCSAKLTGGEWRSVEQFTVRPSYFHVISYSPSYKAIRFKGKEGQVKIDSVKYIFKNGSKSLAYLKGYSISTGDATYSLTFPRWLGKVRSIQVYFNSGTLLGNILFKKEPATIEVEVYE